MHYTGVSYEKRVSKWRAYFTFAKKRVCLGYYKTQEEAAEVRNMAKRRDLVGFVMSKYGLDKPNAESFILQAAIQYVKEKDYSSQFHVFVMTKYDPKQFDKNFIMPKKSTLSNATLLWLSGKSFSEVAKKINFSSTSVGRIIYGDIEGISQVV